MIDYFKGYDYIDIMCAGDLFLTNQIEGSFQDGIIRFYRGVLVLPH